MGDMWQCEKDQIVIWGDDDGLWHGSQQTERGVAGVARIGKPKSWTKGIWCEHMWRCEHAFVARKRDQRACLGPSSNYKQIPKNHKNSAYFERVELNLSEMCWAQAEQKP
jgi:hypothetical protein